MRTAAPTRVRPARLAWGLFALFFAMSTAGITLQVLVPDAALHEQGGSLWWSTIFVAVMAVFGVVGAVVAQHSPANPVGWLFLASALAEGWYELAVGYTHYSLGASPLPGPDWSAWLSTWQSALSPLLLSLAILFFPDGRLPSRRWRPAVWFCVIGTIPVLVVATLAPGSITDFATLTSPVGVEGLSALRGMPFDVAVPAYLSLTAASVVARFRRSHGVERQQVKWFAWSGAMLVLLIVTAGIVETLQGGPGGGSAAFEIIGPLAFAAALSGLPITAGIAILRYRLYDIDLVINRTLVYAILTTILVATYLGSVLALRLALDPLTGQSDLAVAASTLAVAALFRPLRGRVQSVVDRRFYRSRYDAARTLDDFSARLRHEVDLESLTSDLRAAVHDTMMPTHVCLWLREAPIGQVAVTIPGRPLSRKVTP